MEAKKKQRNSVIADDSVIGDWVLIEILRCMPSRSVFKFKTVSKRWLSIISDPSFARLYLSRAGIFSPAPEQRCSLLCKHFEDAGAPVSIRTRPVLQLSIKNHPELDSPNLKLGFLPKRSVKVLAADNGLLLCSYLVENGSLLCSDLNWRWSLCYCVCNPITAQWASVPEPPLVLGDNTGLGLVVRGFGSESVYKIVWVYEVDDDPDFDYENINWEEIDLSSRGLELDVFDSRSGQWRKAPMALSPYTELNMGCRYEWPHVRGVVYNGVLHWQARSGHVHKIIAFDPEMHELEGDDYRCRVFDLPTDESCSGYSVEQRLLGLSGGELRYVEVVSSSFLHVWLLKDYYSGKWCLDHRIEVSELRLLANCFPSGNCSLYVWAFDPVDKDLVYFDFNGETDRSVSLVSCNMSTPKVKVLCTHYPIPIPTDNPKIHLYYNIVHFALSFVVPPWPTHVPSPTHH